MQDSSAEREFEALVEATAEVGALLHRYIDVHNQIFKPSIRHIIPIPGIFKPIDYQRHFEALRFIEMDLERILAELDASDLAINEFAVTLRTYASALLSAIVQLREMCGSLFQKADGTNEYTKRQYDCDFSEYRDRVVRYQQLGARVNAYFGR